MPRGSCSVRRYRQRPDGKARPSLPRPSRAAGRQPSPPLRSAQSSHEDGMS
jgi:hypothetical protein